jgi:phage repressor protein C with HTH and peptisase S24 domain
MHPQIRNGFTCWVHPYLPVGPGDIVLVIKHSDEALIKELVRRTDREVQLRQYNPEKLLAIPRAEIRSLYRILGALFSR